MTAIQTPVLDSLVQELEAARSMSQSFEDMRNVNDVLNDRHVQISGEMNDLREKADHIFEENSRLAAQVPALEEQIMYLTADLADARGEADKLRNEVSVAREGYKIQNDMNTNLHRVIMNHESQIRILKRELGKD